MTNNGRNFNTGRRCPRRLHDNRNRKEQIRSVRKLPRVVNTCQVELNQGIAGRVYARVDVVNVVPLFLAVRRVLIDPLRRGRFGERVGVGVHGILKDYYFCLKYIYLE